MSNLPLNLEIQRVESWLKSSGWCRCITKAGQEIILCRDAKWAWTFEPIGSRAKLVPGHDLVTTMMKHHQAKCAMEAV